MEYNIMPAQLSVPDTGTGIRRLSLVRTVSLLDSGLRRNGTHRGKEKGDGSAAAPFFVNAKRVYFLSSTIA